MNICYLAERPKYLPAIARWQHAEFGYLNPSATLDDRAARLRCSLNGDALPMTLIALSDADAILGCAGVFESTITHPHLSPWLSSVYVPPEHRGGGIASRLSLRAVAEAARLGYERLHLFTPRSATLYARLGWVAFETITHRGTALTLMRRDTAPRATTPKADDGAPT